MAKRVPVHPHLIYAVGTQVVTLADVSGPGRRTLHPRGAVGVVVKSPGDHQHLYRVRFTDGVEASLAHDDLMLLAKFKEGEIGERAHSVHRCNLFERVIYRCVVGYVMSQFKKMQADLRNQGQVKWKHVMHLIRLLLSGIVVLREGYVPVRVEQHREQLLAIRRGALPWDEVEQWRLGLHREFAAAFAETKLADRPDYERANAFLIKARYVAVKG